MSNVKGKGQRLIPEELLKYLQAYKEAHPDPTGGGAANLEDIVDSAGNKRFIEGDGVPLTKEGVTITYCKWSLSGTHLMLVVAGVVANGSTINYYSSESIATFTVPEYVRNKIYETFTYYSEKIVYSMNASFYRTDNGTASSSECFLIKNNDNTLSIGLKSSYTASNTDRPFRIQYDLLIDADYSE